MERSNSQTAAVMRPISVDLKHDSCLATTSGVATFFFWCPGVVITMAAPNINMSFENFTIIYRISFYSDTSANEDNSFRKHIR